MLDLIEPTDTLLTFVIAGIVFVFIILALGVLLKIELTPILASVISNILERILDCVNKYLINFINLIVLLIIINCLLKLLKRPR